MNSLPKSNGRVDILGPIGPQFHFSDKIPINECVSFRDALTGSWDETQLSCAFFSMENINILQNAIKRGVYDKSNKQFVIGQQDCDELNIIPHPHVHNSCTHPHLFPLGGLFSSGTLSLEK